MVRLSDRRLWMVAGAVGAAILMGGTAVLAQAPAKTTAPAVNGAALSHQPAAEPAAAASGAATGPGSAQESPVEQVPAPAAAPPSRPAAVPVNNIQPGAVAPPATDRCMAMMGQGRPLPMCAPLAPQP